MRRALLLAGIVVATLFQFEVFPGHTYLIGETQLYVPMLERLQSPGFLSRDLVASRPDLSFTIYDELTLFVAAATKLDLQRVLEGQQFVARVAAFVGVLLILASCGMGELAAFVCAFLINLGIFVPGFNASTVQPEATPLSIAFGFCVLAFGLLARKRITFAALVGGLALIYSPLTALPFWLTAITGLCFDVPLRRHARATLTTLLVFSLLLGNLAELQPEVSDASAWSAIMSPAMAQVQQYRTPQRWMSNWGRDLVVLSLICLAAGWAVKLLWPRLIPRTRLIFLGPAACGLLGLACSYVLVDQLKLTAVSAIQPSLLVLFTMLSCALAFACAGAQAVRTKDTARVAIWFSLLAAFIVGAAVVRDYRGGIDASTAEAARWAKQNTWAGSIFAFPDAGRDLTPGEFRGLSARGIWVDWESGEVASRSETLAKEWWERWHQTMQGPYSISRLRRLSDLPIDYVVLKREHALPPSVRPAYENRELVVYDNQDLRSLPAL